MSAEKMRKEFEAWSITSAWLGLVGDDLEFLDGGYVYPEVQSAWLSWQASRAAIEVELPNECGANVGKSWSTAFNSARLQCVKAIESRGLKIKQ